MKIFFFIDALNAGGKERRLTELIKGLKANPDIHFELVVMSKDIHYQEILDLGVPIHYILRKTKKDLSVFNKVYKLCKEHHPDCVHCWDSMTSMYVIPAVKLLGIKYVNGMVVDAPRQQNVFNKNWLRGKLAFPFSHLIIGNSQAGLSAYRAPGKKSICIHNGFNFSRVEAISDAIQVKEQLNIETPFVVGMVASFSRYKDYRTYFSAAQAILKQRKDITFLAVGEGTDTEEARALVEEPLQKYFRFLGRKSGVESLINAMDICVLATFTEGISNSILEYMALGKPVVATDGGGTNEIIEDGKTGFLVPPRDPRMLAEKLALLIENSELREQMGKAGRQRVQHDFSIERMVNNYIDNYRKIVSL